MRTLAAAVLGALLALAAVAGCAHASRGTAIPAPSASPPGLSSGITGTTLLRACPVPMDKPCPLRPASMALAVTDVRTGVLVATVTSGKDGAFRVAVPPGRYLVGAAGSKSPLLSRLTPVTVDVRDGAYASVTLRAEMNIQ